MRKYRSIRRMRVGGSMGAGDPGQGAGHAGPSGAGGSRSGSNGGGGAVGGRTNTDYGSGARGATSADAETARSFGLSDREYEDAARGLRDRVEDARDMGEGPLNGIGKTLLGLGGYYEADPSMSQKFAKSAWDSAMADAQHGIHRGVDESADRMIDPFQGLATLAGVATGIPFSAIYGAATHFLGHPEFGQINMGPSGMDNGLSKNGSGRPTPSSLGGNRDTRGTQLSQLAKAGSPGALTAIANAGGAPVVTPPATNPAAPGSNYSPYMDDYLTYGQRPEWNFFNAPPAQMAHGGYVDADIPRMSIGGFLKKLAKKIAPVAIGLGTSALTGSDILGGLAGGASSKLFGNDWMTAGLTGLGSGLASNLTGISGSGEGALGLGGGGAGASGAFGSALDWVKNNPIAAGGGALALASALASAGKSKTTGTLDAAKNSANDPAYAEQIRNGGWESGRKYNAPDDTVNWYQYGTMPEWDYFKDENLFTPVNSSGMKKGGDVSGVTSALAALHNAGGMADGEGGGQDDKIPVYLSAKEYVVPADVVSDLGDGNPDQGAKKLDGMRDKVRKHKGRRGFPPKAKARVEGYL